MVTGAQPEIYDNPTVITKRPCELSEGNHGISDPQITCTTHCKLHPSTRIEYST